MKELHTARALSEFVDVRKEIDFNDEIYFAANAMHCVEYGNPAGHNGSFARLHRLCRSVQWRQQQWIQTDIHFADGIVGRISVMIHDSNLQRLILQIGIVHLRSENHKHKQWNHRKCTLVRSYEHICLPRTETNPNSIADAMIFDRRLFCMWSNRTWFRRMHRLYHCCDPWRANYDPPIFLLALFQAFCLRSVNLSISLVFCFRS